MRRSKVRESKGKKFLSVGKVFFEVQTAAVNHPQPGSQGLSLKEMFRVGKEKGRDKGGGLVCENEKPPFPLQSHLIAPPFLP